MVALAWKSLSCHSVCHGMSRNNHVTFGIILKTVQMIDTLVHHLFYLYSTPLLVFILDFLLICCKSLMECTHASLMVILRGEPRLACLPSIHHLEHHPHHVLLAQEKGHWWRKRSGRESEREIGAVFLWPDAFPFLSPTSTSHSLHLIFSSATNRLLREGTSLAFSSALRCSLCNKCYCV